LGDKALAGNNTKLVKELFIIIPEWLKDFVHIMLMFTLGHFVYDVAKVFMKFVYGVIMALLAMFVFGGCTLHYERDQIGFWDQCIKINGYGFTMATAYGPFNLGYLTYERNVNCDTDIKQQRPFVPALPTKP